MSYSKPGLLHSNCEAIMRIVVFPSSREHFSDFWCPQRFVDMKASDGTVDDKLRHLGKVILKESECEVSTEVLLALLYRECSSSQTVTRLLAIRWCEVANPTIIPQNEADSEMAERASSSHSGVKIRSYTVDFKVRAVETLRNDPDHNISAKSFSIDRKRLREWEKSYDKILEAHFGKGKKSRKLHPGAEVISLELDVAVFEYLEEERSEGRIVRNKD